MGRPLKEINEDQVMKLALIQCTMIEIASFFECSVDTLERRFADVIKIGRENGKISLKRKQYEVAMNGNVPMLIWLGKQTLGQRNDSSAEIQERAEATARSMAAAIKPADPIDVIKSALTDPFMKDKLKELIKEL